MRNHAIKSKKKNLYNVLVLKGAIIPRLSTQVYSLNTQTTFASALTGSSDISHHLY
jgi:hypothetical protein